MMKQQRGESEEQGRALVVLKEVVVDLDELQRKELHRWALNLLAVRNSGRRSLAKAVAAVRLTARREVLGPILGQVRNQLVAAGVNSKRLLWDERNWASRLALGGVAVAGVASSQGAGIAAFGGAIGVPLWLLTSSGGAALGTLIDELEKVIDRDDEDEGILEAEWEEIDRLVPPRHARLSGDESTGGKRLPPG